MSIHQIRIARRSKDNTENPNIIVHLEFSKKNSTIASAKIARDTNLIQVMMRGINEPLIY